MTKAVRKLIEKTEELLGVAREYDRMAADRGEGYNHFWNLAFDVEAAIRAVEEGEKVDA